MGDQNQYQLVINNKDSLSGPFLEVGSRDYGSTPDFRVLFPNEIYVGVDLSQGKSVDVVIDLTLPFDVIDAALNHQRFGTIFSFSVLEHCDQPFLMAENMTRLLKPGGQVVLSVPFAWKFHGYPSDYWRFTQEGIKKLFPKIDWNEKKPALWHSPSDGDFREIKESVGVLSLSGKYYRKKGMFFRGVGLDILKTLRILGIYRWLFSNRYLMLPTMIDMIGALKSKERL